MHVTRDKRPEPAIFLATTLLAPTYLPFHSLAQYLLDEVAGTTHATLRAIATGAIFFGAMTYIGNGPNFMVKAIAEHAGIRMPSFFGYRAWSAAILVPLFGILTLLFMI
jgi:Na+/H+ antiporter NhaD/arsenite permease-like protein